VSASADSSGSKATSSNLGHRPSGAAVNAKLIAWTGVALLLLLAAQGITILRIGELVTWHILIGLLLIPPALLKIATTMWRMVGYYARRPGYRAQNPPILLMRLLGPLVVLSTLALLTTGVITAAEGAAHSREPLIAGFSALKLHQTIFWVWLVVTGLHVLGRLIPAWQIISGAASRHLKVPGASLRIGAFVATALVSITLGALVHGTLVSRW
jgi:hypothetical protein